MKNRTTNACVLIVDDDEDDRWLMSHAFDEVCPQIQKVFACDGEEAVDYMQVSRAPIFILTDLNMPKVNGVELITRLRHHPFYRTIPVVICTTSRSDDDRQRCYLAGANAFVNKPNRLADLNELVRSLVSVWARDQ
jgi:CheY-like chemotaxis protein